MAELVVVDKEQLENDLTVVANAIREKGGTTEQLEFPQEMKQAVEAIKKGIVPSGTVQITENGTHDVTEYASAEVNVVGGGSGIDYLAYRVDTELSGDDGYEYYSEQVTNLSERAFAQDNNIRKLSLPNCERLVGQCCYMAQNLQEVELPKVHSITGTQHFQNTKLTEVSFSNLGSTAISPGFANSYYLEKLDFAHLFQIVGNSYSNCYSFKTFIIRRTDSFSILSNISAFNNCYHFYGIVNETYNPNGLQDGYVYVPRALIERYQTATNWATLYASHPNVFRALEDYTVDGTTAGELDESKI